MEMWTRVTLLVKNKLFMDTVINLAFGKSTITPLEVPYVYIFFFFNKNPKARGAQTAQIPASPLKILDARRLTSSPFHIEYTQIFGVTVHNLVAKRI